jgi:hypothetical protein
MEEEKALKAIMKAEESRRTYKQIYKIVGDKKERKPLTAIKTTNPDSPTQPITLLTKEDMENAILH